MPESRPSDQDRPRAPRPRDPDPDRAELALLQRWLGEALVADDLARLQQLAPALRPAAGASLAHIDAEGFRLAALLIARLRFERLMRLSAPARADFERDPPAFVAAFRRFHSQCPAAPGDPWRDGREFARWWALDRDG